MKMATRVFSDIDALSRGALEELLRVMQDAIKQRGRFADRSFRRAYARKATTHCGRSAKDHGVQTPWDRVHLFWGDERYVAQDDPLSNYRMTRETLIEHVAIPAANVHPVATQSADAREGGRGV